MPPQVSPRKLVIVHTLQPDGAGVVRALVHCSRREATLDSATCVRCKRLAEVQLHDGHLAAVFCDGGEQAGRAPEPSVLPLACIRVEALLSAELICLHSDVGLDVGMEQFLMSSREVLPVVDGAGRLLGLVTESELSLDIHTHAGDPGGRARTVGDVMLPWPLAVPEHTPVTQAAAVLAYERQHHVAVVSATGALIGVLSSSQILRWLASAAGYVL